VPTLEPPGTPRLLPQHGGDLVLHLQREDGQDRALSAGAQLLHELRAALELRRRRKTIGAVAEQLLRDERDEVVGHPAHVLHQELRQVEHEGQRDARAEEHPGGLQQLRAADHEVCALAGDQPEVEGALDHPGSDLAAEQVDELPHRDPLRGLFRPGPGERVLQAQQVGEVTALGPGLQQLGDGGERVATLEQAADEPQPRQVRVGVPADAAAPLRRRQQPPVLVDAHVAHGHAGRPGEVVDAVLRHPCQLRPYVVGRCARSTS
jgi:hypothetical protein